jgi:hypothetical protein
MAARLDIGWCPYNKLASAAFNGRFTSEEHVLVTVGVPSREADDRIRSSGRWQLGLDGHHAVPACRHLLEANPSEDVEMEVEPVSPISLGPTDKELEEVKDLSLSPTQEIATTAVEALSPMPHALEDPRPLAETSTRTEIRPRAPAVPAAPAKATVVTRAKPGVLDATLTYPSLESTVLMPYLKFPGLSDVFTPSDVKAWLDGANRKVPSCGWRRIYRVPRSIRVDYYVEFQSAEAALKVRGLIDVWNGEIREGTFVGEAEIRDVAERMRAVLEQVENVAETAPAPAPYAGGRYLRTEPPTSALLLKKVKPGVPPSSWTEPLTSALLLKKVRPGVPPSSTVDKPEIPVQHLRQPVASSSRPLLAQPRSPPRSPAQPSIQRRRRSRSPPRSSQWQYRNPYLDSVAARPRSPNHSPWTSRVFPPPHGTRSRSRSPARGQYPQSRTPPPRRSRSHSLECGGYVRPRNHRARSRSRSPRRRGRSRSYSPRHRSRSYSPRRRRRSRSRSPSQYKSRRRTQRDSPSRERRKRSRRSPSSSSRSSPQSHSRSPSREKTSTRRRPRTRGKKRETGSSTRSAPASLSLLNRLGDNAGTEEGELEEEGEVPSLLGRVGLDLHARLGDTVAPPIRTHRRLRKCPGAAKRDKVFGHGGAL